MICTEAVTENSLRFDAFHVRFLRGARRWSGVGGRCVTHGAPIKCARGAQGWQVCDFGRAESGRWQLDEAQPFCPLCAREFRCLPTAAGTVLLRSPRRARCSCMHPDIAARCLGRRLWADAAATPLSQVWRGVLRQLHDAHQARQGRDEDVQRLQSLTLCQLTPAPKTSDRVCEIKSPVCLRAETQRHPPLTRPRTKRATILLAVQPGTQQQHHHASAPS
jgi:hypothetical protein